MAINNRRQAAMNTVMWDNSLAMHEIRKVMWRPQYNPNSAMRKLGASTMRPARPTLRRSK